ncbi:hypothetical protein F4Z99_19720 [Candidatus Poribacteria bacterium]|nr:hypothetical protein [Candidatus Poribacteria bacterium]
MPSKNVTGPLLGFLAVIFGFAAVVSLLFGARTVFWILLLFCFTALAIFTRLRFADFVNFFISRQARYGANVALSIVGVIGIAVFVNAIVVQRLDKRADLTRDQLYSLSEPTQKILKSLNTEIHITTFMSEKVPPADRQRTIEMLALYQRETDFLTISHANPYIDIQLVEKYNIRRDGTVIFETPGRQEKVTTLEEQKFTSAILKLVRKQTKKIYFTVGHEERSLGDFNNTGYSEVKAELENQNYAAASLSLLTQPAVPADCEVLVIAGPKNALTAHEIGLVSRYLAQNGKLLLLLDPSVTSAKDVNRGLVQLMKRWGIGIGNDLVVDRVSFVFELGPTAPFSSFQPHDITRSAMQVSIPFAVTRSVRPLADRKAADSAGKPALDVKSLAKTINPTGVSWAETERETDETFNTESYTAGLDMPGPISIAVAAEEKNEPRQLDTSPQSGNPATETTESPTRIVVFGDSDFATNIFFRSASRDLFLATINWLTLEEDLIAIRPIDLRQQALRRMAVQDIRLVQITSVFLIPLIVFIGGLVVWWQRREGGSA